MNSPAEVADTNASNANVKELEKTKITDDEEVPAVEAKGDAAPVQSKKRGRPSKHSLVTAEVSDCSQSTDGTSKENASKDGSVEPSADAESKKLLDEDGDDSVPRKRGRLPKISIETAVATEEEETVEPKSAEEEVVANDAAELTDAAKATDEADLKKEDEQPLSEE